MSLASFAIEALRDVLALGFLCGIVALGCAALGS